MNALEQAITILGRPSALARACGTFPQAVSRWRRQGYPPVKYVLAIERATAGKVSRYQLRPDIYDAPVGSPEPMAMPATSVTLQIQSVASNG